MSQIAPHMLNIMLTLCKQDKKDADGHSRGKTNVMLITFRITYLFINVLHQFFMKKFQ